MLLLVLDKELFMKPILYFIGLVVILFSFGCASSEQKSGEEVFKDQLESFSTSINNIDQAMELITFLNDKIEEIQKDVEKGILTREQGHRLVEELNKTYQREIARRANINPTRHLPEWAKKIKLSEPAGLFIDQDFSRSTAENNPEDGYNSIKLVYKADYDLAIAQAALIARKADIPMSKQYADAFERAEKYPTVKDQIKGIAYVNYDHESKNLKYKISITVDDEGVLTIYAIDDEQRRLIMQAEE